MAAVLRPLLIVGVAAVIAIQASCVVESSSSSSRRQALSDAQAADLRREESGACGGAVGYVGCCIEKMLVYCLDGELVAEGCQQACGWSSSFNFYICGTSSDADPSGQLPRDCPSLDGGLPDGVSDGAVDQSSDSDGIPDQQQGCGALSYVGCCDGDLLVFCSGGALLTLGCQTGTCGWNNDGKYYDCDTNGAADATHPKACDGVIGDASVTTDVGDADLEDGFADGEASDLLQPSDARRDGFAVVDGPQQERDLLYQEGGPPDIVGLDALGLDASHIDGAKGGDSGGCSCEVADHASLVPVLLLTLFFATARRPQRTKNKGERTWRSR